MMRWGVDVVGRVEFLIGVVGFGEVGEGCVFRVRVVLVRLESYYKWEGCGVMWVW